MHTYTYWQLSIETTKQNATGIQQGSCGCCWSNVTLFATFHKLNIIILTIIVKRIEKRIAAATTWTGLWKGSCNLILCYCICSYSTLLPLLKNWLHWASFRFGVSGHAFFSSQDLLKKTQHLSVISLSLLQTKKTHTGAVQQGFLWGLEIMVLLSFFGKERSDILCMQFCSFFAAFNCWL